MDSTCGRRVPFPDEGTCARHAGNRNSFVRFSRFHTSHVGTRTFHGTGGTTREQRDPFAALDLPRPARKPLAVTNSHHPCERYRSLERRTFELGHTVRIHSDRRQGRTLRRMHRGGPARPPLPIWRRSEDHTSPPRYGSTTDSAPVGTGQQYPTLQAMKRWQRRKPELFDKMPYYLQGYDSSHVSIREDHAGS